jgi:putative FmdB family regulatory protein
MPNYVFYCDNCDAEKSITVQISEEIEAPYCNNCEQDMTRQFGIQTIRFIGSGWAKNDS